MEENPLGVAVPFGIYITFSHPMATNIANTGLLQMLTEDEKQLCWFLSLMGPGH